MPKTGHEDRSAKFVIQDINSNKIYIKYYQKTDMSVRNIQDSLNTVNNISVILEENKKDIASNSEKINNIKKTYLKNVYNILLYDQKTQIDFRKDIFYEKVFDDVNANKNDFVEIAFKIELEYQDTDDRHYVKSIYEIFDENNNRLYIKSVTNNDYLYFPNRLIIDENIFYNFTKNVKKIKFIIKFQKLSSSRIIKIFYIKNDNYRLILKHCSST